MVLFHLTDYLLLLCRGTEHWGSANGSSGSRWDALKDNDDRGPNSYNRGGTSGGGYNRWDNRSGMGNTRWNNRGGGGGGQGRWSGLNREEVVEDLDWSKPLPRNESLEK